VERYFDMKQLHFDTAMIALAVDEARRVGKLEQSIINGDGTTAGKLGEIALARYLGADLMDSRDFDLKYMKDIRIEVKTKRRTTDPHENFAVTVDARNVRQKCDYYAFISITFKERKRDKYFSPMRIWFLGYIRKHDFFKKATLVNKGTYQPENNFTVREDHYALPISQLNTITIGENNGQDCN